MGRCNLGRIAALVAGASIAVVASSAMAGTCHFSTNGSGTFVVNDSTPVYTISGGGWAIVNYRHGGDQDTAPCAAPNGTDIHIENGVPFNGNYYNNVGMFELSHTGWWMIRAAVTYENWTNP